jgi:hypothetical protein
LIDFVLPVMKFPIWATILPSSINPTKKALGLAIFRELSQRSKP